jgi:hypothetical protein
MSTVLSSITIVYAGEPVEVARERITGDMFVPNLGEDGFCDDQPGSSAASLFREAASKGALVVPDELTVECHARDDFHFSGFLLVIRPEPEAAFGITSSWCDVETIARARGDHRADNDPTVIREALDFMAREINAALGVEYELGT